MSRAIAPGLLAGVGTDPAAAVGMVLWIDEASFCPDGAYASTIQGGVYVEIINRAQAAPEQSRYFGQSDTTQQPAASSLNGWRCASFVHDDAGTTSTRLSQSNSNTNYGIGLLSAYVPADTGRYVVGCATKIPSGMNEGENYIAIGVPATTWNLYLTISGGHVSLNMLQQGAMSGTKTATLDLTVAGAAVGDVVVLYGRYDGTNVYCGYVNAAGVRTEGAGVAVDAMNAAALVSRICLGGFGGTRAGSFKGPIPMWFLNTTDGLMSTLVTGIMATAAAKYNAATSQTWADIVELDPLTLSPSWAPGAFTGNPVSSIADASGGGRPFTAAGAARPAATTIGALAAITGDGAATAMDQSVGSEGDIWPAGAWTTFNMCRMKVSDQTPTGVQSAPCVLFGESLRASTIFYPLTDSRGPMIFYEGTGGPHAGECFTTLQGAIPDMAATVVVISCHSFDPSVLLPDGSPTVRSETFGAMASDYGSDNAGSLTGPCHFLKRGTSYFKGDAVPSTVIPGVVNYPNRQRVRRWFYNRST